MPHTSKRGRFITLTGGRSGHIVYLLGQKVLKGGQSVAAPTERRSGWQTRDTIRRCEGGHKRSCERLKACLGFSPLAATLAFSRPYRCLDHLQGPWQSQPPSSIYSRKTHGCNDVLTSRKHVTELVKYSIVMHCTHMPSS